MTLVVLLPLGAFAVALVYVQLLFGEIRLNFLAGPIRDAIARSFQGVIVTIAEVALDRGDDGQVELRLRDMRLAETDGGLVAGATEAVVGLDFAALWMGRIVPSRLLLKEPRIVVLGDERVRPGPSASAAAEVPAGGGTAPAPALPGMPSERTAGQPDLPGSATAPAFGRRLAEMIGRLRRGEETGSGLQKIGLSNASLVIDGPRRQTLWSVPDLEMTLAHKSKRSVIAGQGRVTSGGEPWSLAFRLEDSDKSQRVRLETHVAGLVPRTLVRNLPQLAALAALDLPIAVDGVTELTQAGDVVTGAYEVTLGEGRVVAPTAGETAVGLDRGRLSIRWDGPTGRVELQPSALHLGRSHVKVAGHLVPTTGPGGASGYAVTLGATEGAILNDSGAPLLPVERLSLEARIWPDTGSTELRELAFKAGGAEIAVAGTVTGGGDQVRARLDGRIGPMSVSVLKAVWPTQLAPELRTRVRTLLHDGVVRGGSFVLVAGEPGSTGPRFTLDVAAGDLVMATGLGHASVAMPRADLRLDGDKIEVDVPEAHFPTRSGKSRLAVKGTRIIVPALGAGQPVAEVETRAQGPLAAVVELLGADGGGLLKPGLVPAGADGKVDAHFRASVPVASRHGPGDVRLEGKIRITDGRIPDALGPHDVTGATLTIGATDKAVDVKGEMLIAGILAKVGGQWIVGESPDRQPPLRISTRLDTADRRQLGLDLDDMVQGEVPIEIEMVPGDGDRAKVLVTADLTGAELILDGVAWRKAPGRAARLSFEAVRPRGSKGLELQAFKISGDSITVDGSVSIGPDNKVQSYRFPGFSLDVVSNLGIEGTRRKDRVWEVKARGKTFDASSLIRNRLTVGAPTKRPAPKASGRSGMELEATIDTVLGRDANLQQVRLRLSERDDEMVALELGGRLETGTMTVSLPAARGGPRILQVETDNAGAALRLAGLYMGMQGGRGGLRVNLDAQGAAERSGQATIKSFRLLGDPVVSEVLQSADDSRPAIASGSRGARREVREQIGFDDLRVSFSTGSGQIALESLVANGPLIGVSLRGKADFRTNQLSLGGTYVPLSGLNRALSGIPIVRELLTGPKGDGVFGITFAVNGPMSEPQVIVNPFSIVAPGLLREIFQMSPENVRVTPDSARPGASGSSGGNAAKAGKGQPRIHDGWSSQTTRP
jgi:hypothetical protein